LRRLIFSWLPPVIWMGVIFWFSHQSTLPTVAEPDVQYLISKAAHLTEYAILAVLLLRASYRSLGDRHSPSVAFYLAFGAAVVYAASDEFHQSFTPGRHPSIVDVVIDGGGAVAGLILTGVLVTRSRVGMLLIGALVGERLQETERSE